MYTCLVNIQNNGQGQILGELYTKERFAISVITGNKVGKNFVKYKLAVD